MFFEPDCYSIKDNAHGAIDYAAAGMFLYQADRLKILKFPSKLSLGFAEETGQIILLGAPK